MKMMFRGATVCSLTLLTGCNSPQQSPAPNTRNVSVASGHSTQLGFFASLGERCASLGTPLVTVVEQPAHGTLDIRAGSGNSHFPPSSPLAACNMRRSPGMLVTYQSAQGFVGSDRLTIRVQFPSGGEELDSAVISVR
ncbi:hypothetical protein [Methylovirgula sp. 4M-Z18]|uniref:hypothetical protein n=1 Tax=Methylovirgula sp. 4M-Z18 TaxID=2293567 RepID=UPI0011C054DE|nr:hypothetical protein [Methylovirgula sp. 4M-Z18]